MVANYAWAPRKFESLAAILTDALCSQSGRGYRLAGISLLAFFGCVVAILCIWGSGPVAGPWNMAILLDGAWRILHGQVPHTDFHNPIGPVPYLLVAFGMRVAAPSTSSIPYGIALLLVLLLPCAWRIAATRLPAILAWIVVLFIGVFIVSPRPLGAGIHETSYGVIYNREGYALTVILLISVFLTRREDAKSADARDGLIAGLLLGALLYCKITYFAVAAASTLVAFALAPKTRRWVVACAAGLLAVCALAYVAFHVSLRAYLADIAGAGAAQSTSMRVHFLIQSLLNNATWIYLLVWSLGVWSWSVHRAGAESLPMARAWSMVQAWPLRAWLSSAWIVAVALLVSSGNASQQGLDDPLFFTAAVIALETLRRHVPQTGQLTYAASALLLLPVFCGAILARDLASFGYSAVWSMRERPAYPQARHLHSARLQDFFVPESTSHITAYWPASEHPRRINDGIDLLRAHLKDGDTVTTIALANPFSFALGLTPARDGPLWWDLGISFDQKHFPPAEEYLGQTSLVMIPRRLGNGPGWSFETVDALLEHYGNYLQAHFQEIGANDTWILYRRRS